LELTDSDQNGFNVVVFYKWQPVGDLYRGEPGDEEPAWVENERESFRTYRDKNKDGFLDKDEVSIEHESSAIELNF
jgi:hypothetical protein